MRCVLLALGLLVAGCPDSDEEPAGGEVGGGGVGGAGGDTGQPFSAGVGGGEQPAAAGAGPAGTGGGDLQSCSLPDTLVEVAPEQPRDWAAGQFSAAIIEGGWLPPAKSLSFPHVRDYLQDLVNVDAVPNEQRVSFSLVSRPEVGSYVLKGRALGTASSESKANLVVLLDVSPSTASVAEGRDAVLNSLADGVDARDGFTFSLLSFAGGSQLIVDRVVSGEARAALDLERTRLAYVEGGDLPGALKSAQDLLKSKDGDDFAASHVLILTDGGLVPNKAVLAQVEQLVSSGKDVHVSVAQLSTVPLFTASTPVVAPTELYSELLSEISRRGRGMSFFFPGGCGGCTASEAVDASFGRWFSPFESMPNFGFALPGGLTYLPDPADVPGEEALFVGLAGLSSERAVQVQNQCGELLNNTELKVTFGSSSMTATLTADANGELSLSEAAARTRADARLKAAVEAMREPADFCAQISGKLASAGAPLSCGEGDFDCRYVALVEDFVAKARGLCPN